ncbi:hypothetical protein YC2023_084767 [Brassica napus]
MKRITQQHVLLRNHDRHESWIVVFKSFFDVLVFKDDSRKILRRKRRFILSWRSRGGCNMSTSTRDFKQGTICLNQNVLRSHYYQHHHHKHCYIFCEYTHTSACKLEESSNGLPVVPCGLIAWSMLYDTNFSRERTKLKVSRNDTAWKSDHEHKFRKNVFPFNFQNGTLISGPKLDPKVTILYTLVTKRTLLCGCPSKLPETLWKNGRGTWNQETLLWSI